MITSREIRLKSRPVGMPTVDNFELVTVSVPAPTLGEVQVKNLWMSVDPYMRGRMVDRTSYDHLPLSDATPAREIGEAAASNSTMYGWRPLFQLGEALQGGAIGEVVASEDPRFKPGDLVSSMFGWRERFNAPASTLEKLDTLGLPPQAFLGVAGVTGLTAWSGLLKIAALKSGDVVFVSAAAGAVGSVACQIAKLKGHTVIGSAGGANKCAFLRNIGVDHVIDYKSTSNLTEALLRAAPNGIDVYFDNVGGNHLEAALAAANRFARFVLCGMISQYNTVGLPEGPRNIMFVINASGWKALTSRITSTCYRNSFKTCLGGYAMASSCGKRASSRASQMRRQPSSSSSRARTSERCWLSWESASGLKQYSQPDEVRRALCIGLAQVWAGAGTLPRIASHKTRAKNVPKTKITSEINARAQLPKLSTCTIPTLAAYTELSQNTVSLPERVHLIVRHELASTRLI
jgi:NADPH-dependent curcumin reductase CurA